MLTDGQLFLSYCAIGGYGYKQNASRNISQNHIIFYVAIKKLQNYKKNIIE